MVKQAKLFASANAGTAGKCKEVSSSDAAKAVGAVTGADILQAMIKDNGDAVKLASSNAVAAVDANKKDGVIAGGIALRDEEKEMEAFIAQVDANIEKMDREFKEFQRRYGADKSIEDWIEYEEKERKIKEENSVKG